VIALRSYNILTIFSRLYTAQMVTCWYWYVVILTCWYWWSWYVPQHMHMHLMWHLIYAKSV